MYASMYEFGSRVKNGLRKHEVYKNYRRLVKEQYLTSDELHRLQLVRLKTIVKHAKAHSLYYSKILENIELDKFSIKEFSKVPVLTRQLLQENLDSILIDSPGPGLFLNSSGGSTGKPVNFYQDREYGVASEYHNLFFLSWMGIRRGDKTAIFWGADRDYKDWSLKEKLRSSLRREVICNSFKMDNVQIIDFINKLNKFQPKYIYGYASSLYLVAEKIEELGIEVKFIPLAISSSAEMLYPFQRIKIEQIFNAKIFNYYGSREINNIGVECDCHTGMHVNASSRYIEIVDDDNKVLPDGELGYVAVTDYLNHSFPFIRYLNGDMASLSKEPCECGRSYPIFDKFQGRSTDFIVTEKEMIHGEYFTHMFYNRPEIKQFQLIQETKKSIVLLVVPKSSKKDINLAVFKKIIQDKVGEDININIKLVDEIATTATGKYRFTISKVKSNS